jgi:hypothetical protein
MAAMTVCKIRFQAPKEIDQRNTKVTWDLTQVRNFFNGQEWYSKANNPMHAQNIIFLYISCTFFKEHFHFLTKLYEHITKYFIIFIPDLKEIHITSIVVLKVFAPAKFRESKSFYILQNIEIMSLFCKISIFSVIFLFLYIIFTSWRLLVLAGSGSSLVSYVTKEVRNWRHLFDLLNP